MSLDIQYLVWLQDLRAALGDNLNEIFNGISKFAVVIMPLSYSIATGIMFAMMFWVLIKVCTGKSKDVSPVMWVIFAIFALRILALVTSFS